MRRSDGAEAGEIRPRPGVAGYVASGTLACPACDAPVAPGPAGLRPADPLHCPVCAHSARVRDFLSLASPARPARVAVRIVPGRHGRRSWLISDAEG